MIVAIDGPAGSGKSTVARLVADKSGFHYLDSGALYRSLTLLVCLKAVSETLDAFLQDQNKESIVKKISMLSENDIFPILKDSFYVSFIEDNNMEIRFELEKSKGDTKAVQTQNMYLDSKNVSTLIRFPEITKNIRYIANHKESRELVNSQLRSFAKEHDVVIDGRDIGSAVFPNADLKFYLDASVEVRAKRRFDEYKEKGLHAELSLASIQEDIASRDKSDFERTLAPLKVAENAIVVDTTALSREEVFNTLLETINKKKIL